MHLKVLVWFVASGLFFSGITSSDGATSISGNQSGTLSLTNSPYLVTANLVVPSGQTLTIQPGVVLQFQNPDVGMFVDGTLIARGTSASPILFTSDEANKQPGQWLVLSIRAAAGTNTVLENCIVECAGGPGAGENIILDNTSAPLLTNCTIRTSGGHGITFLFSDARVQNCSFNNNANFAMYMRADSLPVLRNNSASGNGKNATGIFGFNVNRSGTWTRDNIPYTVVDTAVVNGGVTLTIEPGTTVQVQDPDDAFIVDGTLIARGTPGTPILFTSDETTKQGAQWQVVWFRGSTGPNTIMENCIVEAAGGFGFNENICLENTSAPLITNCISRTSGRHGLTFLFSDARVQNCVFSNNADFAMAMRTDSLPVVRNNSASGNGKNAIGIFGFNVNRSGTWVRDNIPYTAIDTVLVNSGVTLTIEPGAIVQFQDQEDGLFVDGTLIARGTPSSPILFTSNKASKQPAQWQVLAFRQSAGTNTVLENCVIECAGGFGVTESVRCESTSAPLITNCIIRTSGAHGINFQGSDARVQNCTFSNNLEAAMTARVDSFPILRNNAAIANGKNTIGLYGFNVNRTGTWTRDNIPYTAFDSVVVLGGVTLTIEPGTTMQFQDADDGMFIDGTLIARGTTNSPILFTSDEPLKQPAQWQVLWFRQSAGTNTILENCVIECAGSGLGDNIRLDGTSAPLISNCTVRASGGHGINFLFSDARVENCQFHTNRAYAMVMRADSFPRLRNSSASGNTNDAIGVYGLNVNRSGTWLKDNLPYTAIDPVFVNAGVTLTLNPGLIIQFQDPDDGFFVDGTLIANGTTANPILFTSDNAVKLPGQWQQVSFRDQSDDTNSVFNNCIIEYGGAFVEGSLTFFSASPRISNTIIRNSTNDGIHCNFSSPQITSCRILNSGRDGVRTVNGSSPIIANCVISGSVGLGANNFDTSRIIKAENNYWGHPSGPFDNSNADGQGLTNLTGLGARVSEYVDWSPFSGSDPTGGGAQGPDIDLSTTNLNFGNVTVGQTNQMTLIIYNVGNSNLNVTSLTSDNPQFTFISPSTPFGVAAQQVITVRFGPVTSGSHTGKISIASNDSDEPLVSVTVSGTSFEPDIALGTTSIDFGSVNIGTNSERTLTVSNVGSSTLTVTSFSVNNSAFRVISPTAPFNIAASGRTNVTLRFTPVVSGSQNGSLSIANNDSDEATVAVALTGTGVTNTSGQTNLCGGVTNGLVSWWRAENSAADSQGTNHGVLRNGATYAAGKVGQGFSFAGISSHVEAPMGEMSVGTGDFTVEGWIRSPASSFQPAFSTIISFGGVAIYLRDDGAGNARLDLWPAGSAGGGTGFADGQFHHFAVVRQGTANNNITYYKDGTNIGAAGHSFPLNTNKCSIGWDFAAQNYPFTGIIDELSFYKRSLSAAEIQAIANAGSAGKCTGGGGGTNAVPDIALIVTNLNFGSVNLGASSEVTMSISNVGASTLTITSLATNNSAFRTVTPVTPLNIAAGTQALLTIRFTPATSGTVTGAVFIASNDPDEANVTLGLVGSGVSAPPIITSITPSNAPSGSTVTISGANFGNNASELLVTFGNHLGVVQSVAATQIVVRLPLIVSGSVSVVATRGGESSNPFTLQVQSPASSLRITDVSLTATDSVRLLTQPAWPVPEQLLLESADSPLGPWWKDPDFQRNNVVGGHEFLTPRRPYYAQRYFRVGAFANQALPFIAYIAPNEYVQRGQSVTLLGANFSPVPAQNIVRFELPSQSWIATVTAAATNYLVATVPSGLFATNTGSGFLYRVTVTTAQGTGNGVGCSIYSQQFWDSFTIRPDQAYILQPPGTGMETLVVGGGVPPYQLVPQSSNDLTVAVASLNGPILKVAARTNVSFRSITVQVQDSSVPPRQASADVSVIQPTFAPPFSAAFHTSLAGTAPGVTMTTEFYSLQPEQIELRLQNVQIELDSLSPGSLLGLVRLFYSSSAYGFQRMVVTDIGAGRAGFDLLTFDDGNVLTNAHGELIQNPPTLVFNVIGQQPGAIMPTTVDQELMIADGVFRLPAAPGESFSIIANFTSVSANENQYAPLRSSITNKFTTTGVAAGAPRIERVLPVHGEIGRNIRLRGTGFDPNPTNNLVTFTGPLGLRVPADIVLQTNGEIFVTVPSEAIAGPVRLSVGGKTGNDFSFFVRFHPSADMVFADFTANTPTAPHFFHQQPVDEDETIGEVPIQNVITTIDQGRLALTGVTSNQQVGTVIVANFYTGRKSTNVLVYKGQETLAPQRHRFEVLANANSSSSHALARLYALDDSDGSGVAFQVEGGLFPFNAGIAWDYQFTAPIYRPPATAGADVTVRIETVSQQWAAIPRSEMRVIQTSTQRVK